MDVIILIKIKAKILLIKIRTKLVKEKLILDIRYYKKHRNK